MEFPDDHHHHHQRNDDDHHSHHQRNDGADEKQPSRIVYYPPPPNGFERQLKPSEIHVSHEFNDPDLSTKPDFKVYWKANPEFHLTIREGSVVLAPLDPSAPFQFNNQKWYKDEKYSTIVKDRDGYPCLAFVNKATGQAIMHSIGDGYPVQLVPYNPDVCLFYGPNPRTFVMAIELLEL